MKSSEQYRSNRYTVKPVLEAAASNYFDEIFAQNLLSKNCILLRLLFEGGFYLRAASNTGFTVGFYYNDDEGFFLFLGELFMTIFPGSLGT